MYGILFKSPSRNYSLFGRQKRFSVRKSRKAYWIDVRDSATVRVVLLAARDPVQFTISFLLHNEPPPIGSKAISTRLGDEPKERLRRELPSAPSGSSFRFRTD